MRNFYLYKKEILFSIILFLLPFVFPQFGITNVGILVTPLAAVFAIVTGFFIADAMANYLRLQTLIAEENATLVALADSSRRIDKKKSVRVHRAIDQYMITQLNVGTLNYVLKTRREMDEVCAVVSFLTPNMKNGSSYEHLLGLKEKIHLTRQEILLTTKKTLTTGHWFTLILFAVLMQVTVFAIRDSTFLMDIVSAFMNVGIFALLILLRDIDNNRLLENKLSYQNPQEVFHAVGQPPFYPYFSAGILRMPDESGT